MKVWIVLSEVVMASEATLKVMMTVFFLDYCVTLDLQ